MGDEKNQALRVLRIAWDLLHCRYGRTIRDLLVDYPASRRSLYRDLAVIEQAKLPLERIKREGGETLYRIKSRGGCS